MDDLAALAAEARANGAVLIPLTIPHALMRRINDFSNANGSMTLGDKILWLIESGMEA